MATFASGGVRENLKVCRPRSDATGLTKTPSSRGIPGGAFRGRKAGRRERKAVPVLRAFALMGRESGQLTGARMDTFGRAIKRADRKKWSGRVRCRGGGGASNDKRTAESPRLDSDVVHAFTWPVENRHKPIASPAIQINFFTRVPHTQLHEAAVGHRYSGIGTIPLAKAHTSVHGVPWILPLLDHLEGRWKVVPMAAKFTASPVSYQHDT
ncbi:hypothetical protein F5148DRAFT_1150138 [Russula earlei]|uniref:Uncharacterized protein n=1 Tax=Russula earlei TaxID=71964 RepID=A0ACC0U741_9AGAM|nr:hypothetical protein F5148DRAFT_1150138 [Russula earlei]